MAGEAKRDISISSDLYEAMLRQTPDVHSDKGLGSFKGVYGHEKTCICCLFFTVCMKPEHDVRLSEYANDQQRCWPYVWAVMRTNSPHPTCIKLHIDAVEVRTSSRLCQRLELELLSVFQCSERRSELAYPPN